MLHSELCGTHYEMGLALGTELRRQGCRLLGRVPFPLTQERLDFACACLPHYRAHFPAVLEEIRGLAEGQDTHPALLQGVLFSMYALPPSCHCSCFAVFQPHGVFLGRNSDFLTALEGDCRSVLCRPSGPAHSFLGHTTSFLQMEDGVNAQGLAAGLTSVHPGAVRPGLNAGMLLRLLLETCASVPEALDLLSRVPIASAQTLILAHRSGEAALVECCPGGYAEVRTGPSIPYVCSTNVFHIPAMQPFRIPSGDDWAAEPRWQTMERFLARRARSADRGALLDLLAGQHGFLCQYDRRTGRDTVWSVLYDLTGSAVLRAEGNPARVPFRRDSRFLF